MKERTPKTYGYARASTKKQIESPDTQKEMIKKYAIFNNLGDVTFFVDPSTSGKVEWEAREAGRALFAQLRAGDNVVFTKLDRAFRRLSDCVFVLDKFKRIGVKLHVCNLMGGAIDLSSPMGVFMIHILAAFAELERAFISERTKDGLARSKKVGKKYVRYPGYGFSWEKRIVDGKKLLVRVSNHEEREVMASIVAWRMQDQPLGWDEIRQHLTYTLELRTKEGKLWDRSRIQRAFQAELALQLKESGMVGMAMINGKPSPD